MLVFEYVAFYVYSDVSITIRILYNMFAFLSKHLRLGIISRLILRGQS